MDECEDRTGKSYLGYLLTARLNILEALNRKSGNAPQVLQMCCAGGLFVRIHL